MAHQKLAQTATAQTATRGRRVRRWLTIIGFNIVAVALLTEIGLRVFAPCWFLPVIPPVYEPHPVYGYFHIPNSSVISCTLEFTVSVDINSHGLRDDTDLEYAKPDGVQRVLVIGDSFTEGFGVQAADAYAAQLEALLNADGISVQVINGGVTGYGTAHALKFLANQGVRYQPDLVIYAFFLNDVIDNTLSQLFELDGGKLNALPVDESRAPAVLLNRNSNNNSNSFRNFLKYNFHTYRALNSALRRLAEQLNIVKN
ncbi:MAG: SGNH/GDSL hydrolase family protein, partial [Aggregatilineales bacterium]